MDNVKKMTTKDRYGNTISYEFESPVKPIDQTELMKEMMKGMQEVPMMETPEYDHPGEPQGTDTVPAWLTPGEFVMNKEATDMYGPEIEAMNNHGRAIQAGKGKKIPGYDIGGKISKLHDEGYTAPGQAYAIAKSMGYQTGGQVPFIAAPMLTDPKYMDDGGWVTDELLDQLAFIESSNNNEAVSKAGAIGKYQWLPSSAKQAGYGIKPFNPKDEKAARAATKKYLENMAKYHNFTPREALTAYNWGPGNVLKYKSGKRKDIPREARQYADKILGPAKLPTSRPTNEIPIAATPERRPDALDIPVSMPVPRPEGGTNQDHLKNFLAQHLQAGGYPNTSLNDPIDYKPIAQSIDLGGEEDIDYTQDTFETQGSTNPMYDGIDSHTTVPVDEYSEIPGPAETPWWGNLLGHKSKSALDLPLTETEQRHQQEAGKFDSAINPSLVGDDPVGEGYAPDNLSADIEGTGKLSKKDKMILAENTETGEKKVVEKKELEKNLFTKINEQTKNAEVVDKSDSDIKAAAEKDPDTVSKAGEFLKGVLGDLFDPKELTRAAVMYAGSRLLGYSHQGSLRHSLKNYVNRVDTKTAAKEKFVQDNIGKFTAESLEEWKKSGDYTDLLPVGAPINTTGQFKTFYAPNGKQIRAEQVKSGKNTYWMTSDGKRVNSSYTDDASLIPGTQDYNKRVTTDSNLYGGMLKELKDQFGAYDTKDGKKYTTELTSKVQGNNIAKWAIKNRVDPTTMGDIVSQAYHSALNDAKERGVKVRDITPYLNDAYVKAIVSDANLLKDPDGKPVSTAKLETLNNQVVTQLSNLPKYQGVSKTTIFKDFFNEVRTDWYQLDQAKKDKYNKNANDGESGFYLFAKETYDEVAKKLNSQ